MKHWLYRQEFSYKKPKGIPSKADPEKQQKFVEYYEDLLNTLPEDEPVEFSDGVPPHNGNKNDLWLDQERSDKDYTNNGFTYTNESDELN